MPQPLLRMDIQLPANSTLGDRRECRIGLSLTNRMSTSFFIRFISFFDIHVNINQALILIY